MLPIWRWVLLAVATHEQQFLVHSLPVVMTVLRRRKGDGLQPATTGRRTVNCRSRRENAVRSVLCGNRLPRCLHAKCRFPRCQVIQDAACSHGASMNQRKVLESRSSAVDARPGLLHVDFGCRGSRPFNVVFLAASSFPRARHDVIRQLRSRAHQLPIGSSVSVRRHSLPCSLRSFLRFSLRFICELQLVGNGACCALQDTANGCQLRH